MERTVVSEHTGSDAENSAAVHLRIAPVGCQRTRELGHLEVPHETAIKKMLTIWAANVRAVNALSDRWDARGHPDRRRVCCGCGTHTFGHTPGAVHGRCPQAMCHCGIHRCLHPALLKAGRFCRGEWRRIVSSWERGASTERVLGLPDDWTIA